MNTKSIAPLDIRCKEARQVQGNVSDGVVHFVLTSRRNSLCLSLWRQPGQIQFVTGLRYDIFGISCNNLNCTKVFGLPERYCPGTKDATFVLSMIYQVIEDLCFNPPTKSGKRLVLHADNCSGQNKNPYTLWFLCWLVCYELYDVVELRFSIPGHTKNVCDGASDHIKRDFRKSEVLVPGDALFD